MLMTSFGNSGKATTLINGADGLATNILLTADSTLIATGSTWSANQDFAITKFFNDGTVDSQFGNNGITTTDFLGYVDKSFHSAIQSDGKIVVVGQANDNSKDNIALARYNFHAMPLRLLSFNAMKKNRQTHLQWKTSEEINVDKFQIERSENGQKFYQIGELKANSNDYTFFDNQPTTGINYYRLKIIDKDGKFEYSPIRMVNKNNNVMLAINPNPVANKLNLEITSEALIQVEAQIINLSGSVFSLTKLNSIQGTILKKLDVANLKAGTYFLRIVSSNEEVGILKFEKL